MPDQLSVVFAQALTELTTRLQRIEALEAAVSALREESTALRKTVEELRAEVRSRTVVATNSVTVPTIATIATMVDPPAPVLLPGRSGTLRSLQDIKALVAADRLDQSIDRDLERPMIEAPRRPFVKSLPATDDELPTIEDRCHLKAEACRWAEERRRRSLQSPDFRGDVEPKDRDLIAQAKLLPDCFLWMSHPTAPNPEDPADWLVLAGAFDVLGFAVGLMRKLLEEGEEGSDSFQQAVDLLAEAQSSVRVAVLRLEGPPTDHDQARVFGWLKNLAMSRQIFIRRFMRLDDPADPSKWSDLSARMVEFQGRWEGGRKKVTSRKKILGRLKFKLSQLNDPGVELAHAWRTVADDVDELVRNGLPPSNVELREMLIDHVEQLPELADMPMGFQLTIREIDRFLAASPTRAETDEPSPTDPLFGEVAGMLGGKAVVLIGGERRPHAAESIEKAFHLSELIWIDTRAHESTAGFEPYVARPEVAMVLLAIRWSSHSYGEVQDFCRQYGKPLVRLPGGYNPRQIAAQICDQCSERLAVG